MDVDLGGLDGFMSEPESDHGGVDAGVEEAHGAGVSQGVRGNGFGGQRRA